MRINILDILKDQVSGTLSKQASSYLGASENEVSNALGGIFPTLLGSMIEKGNSQTGANGIMGMIKGLDLGMLDDIGGLFGDGGTAVDGLLNSGGGIIDVLLGKNVGGVIDMISKVSGLGSGKTGSLLKMAAPFLLKIIANKVGSGGISGLMNLLMGQKDHVKSALPAGMGSLLGLSSLGNFQNEAKEAFSKEAGSVTGTVAGAEKAAGSTVHMANEGSGLLKWLIPVLLAALLAYFLFTKGCSGTDDDLSGAPDKTTETISDAMSEADGAIADASKSLLESARAAFSNVNAEAKAVLDNITFSANSAGKQMIEFIEGAGEDALFRFNNLNFQTGSAQLSPDSGTEIDNVAAILKAYPDVKIEVQGHTDNTGNAEANQTLSHARAESVKARLIAQGIAGTRIGTIGYGQENPVADNGTAEGRAENRRIEIKIVN